MTIVFYDQQIIDRIFLLSMRFFSFNPLVNLTDCSYYLELENPTFPFVCFKKIGSVANYCSHAVEEHAKLIKCLWTSAADREIIKMWGMDMSLLPMNNTEPVPWQQSWH
jgi:hypothetical protein